jgi:hypothetical protein
MSCTPCDIGQYALRSSPHERTRPTGLRRTGRHAMGSWRLSRGGRACGMAWHGIPAQPALCPRLSRQLEYSRSEYC